MISTNAGKRNKKQTKEHKKVSCLEKPGELIFPVMKYLVGCFVTALLCFRSLMLGVVFLLGLPVYLHQWKKQRDHERMGERAIQFRDALSSLAASLEAGYSMERAVASVQKDLSGIYSEKTWICREFQTLVRANANAVPMEEAINSFAARSGMEDAMSFAKIYATARKSGGNLIQILHQTVSVLSDKMEVEREIRTILTSKRLECRIMKLMPPGILLYFRLFSPAFLEFFYLGWTGRLLMFVLLLCYLFFCWLMEHMLHTHFA